MTWQPIETYPYDKIGKHYLLCHKEKKWIRFGKWYPLQKEWYYSGTNERCQYAQTVGDAPTHWQEIPELPK
jgi:hypothetical protein